MPWFFRAASRGSRCFFRRSSAAMLARGELRQARRGLTLELPGAVASTGTSGCRRCVMPVTVTSSPPIMKSMWIELAVAAQRGPRRRGPRRSRRRARCGWPRSRRAACRRRPSRAGRCGPRGRRARPRRAVRRPRRIAARAAHHAAALLGVDLDCPAPLEPDLEPADDRPVARARAASSSARARPPAAGRASRRPPRWAGSRGGRSRRPSRRARRGSCEVASRPIVRSVPGPSNCSASNPPLVERDRRRRSAHRRARSTPRPGRARRAGRRGRPAPRAGRTLVRRQVGEDEPRPRLGRARDDGPVGRPVVDHLRGSP